MDGKAKMIGNGKFRTQTPNVAASVSELTHNVIELGELQAQLFTLDLKKTSQRARTCMILSGIGGCVLLGTIPVALFTLAELMVQLGWPRWAGFGLATLVGLVVGAIFIGAGWLYFRQGLVSLQRSRDELNRNIAWIKSTLRSRGQVDVAERTKTL